MVNWSNPTLSQLWTDFLDAIKSRDVSNATMTYSGDTNIPTSTIRYNRATDRLEEWNGSTWVAQPLDASNMSGTLPTGNIANGAVTNAKIANMAEATVKGRAVGAGTGSPQDLSASSARTVLGLGTAAVENVAAGGSGNLLRADGDGSGLSGVAAFPSGTRMPFHQTAAPTGWTKDTTANLNNTALRVTTGTVGSRTTQSGFTTVFNKSATDDHALTISEIPIHSHDGSGLSAASAGNHSHTQNTRSPGGGADSSGGFFRNTNSTQGSVNIGISGAGAHTHSISGTTGNAGGGATHRHNMDIRVNYHDVIIAAKD